MTLQIFEAFWRQSESFSIDCFSDEKYEIEPSWALCLIPVIFPTTYNFKSPIFNTPNRESLLFRMLNFSCCQGSMLYIARLEQSLLILEFFFVKLCFPGGSIVSILAVNKKVE